MKIIVCELLYEKVVVGYGTRKKKYLTGSVDSIATERITQCATPDLTASLSGLAAGVCAMQGKGIPGLEHDSFSFCGWESINNCSPTFLADGVAAGMTVINTVDAEIFNCFKDAALPVVYVSRVTNDISLVTTKKRGQEKPGDTISSRKTTKGFLAYRRQRLF